MPRGVGLTREKVIDLAAEVADQTVGEPLDLTRLAKRCGVRKPSLYNHIHGLTDLHSELAVRAYQAMYQAISNSEDTAELAHRWRDWALAHPGVYRSATPTHLGLTQRGRDVEDRVLQALFHRLEDDGLCAGGSLSAARALRSLIHGFVTLELDGGFGLDEPVDLAFRKAVSALVTGLHRDVANGSRIERP